MSLLMGGHIDDVFKSIDVNLIYSTGQYVNGIWQAGATQSIAYTATVQPLNERELDNIERGGQRILDSRKIYINSGDYEKLALAQEFEFLGQLWKIFRSDVRPWREYAKIICVRYDDQ